MLNVAPLEGAAGRSSPVTGLTAVPATRCASTAAFAKIFASFVHVLKLCHGARMGERREERKRERKGKEGKSEGNYLILKKGPRHNITVLGNRGGGAANTAWHV